MNRKYWITSTNDFKRVRLSGRSTAHPLVVIIYTSGESTNARAGIITGKAIGNAVKRNQARRRLRMILMDYLPKIATPMDLVVIGRTPISTASYVEIKSAVQKVLIKARLIEQNDSM